MTRRDSIEHRSLPSIAGIRSRGRLERRRAKLARRPAVEVLEGRVVLSTINWVNRDKQIPSHPDNFGIYGPNAELARRIVDAAIADWQAVIQNFNYRVRSNAFEVTVTARPLEKSTVAGQVIDSKIQFDGDGRPFQAEIELDDNGGGGRWYFDPTPADDSEFTPKAPFQASMPGRNVYDFYSAVVHELGHSLGFTIDERGRLWTGKLLEKDEGSISKGDQVYNFRGPTATATFVKSHLYEGGGIFTPSHPGDLMIREYDARTDTPRRLISDLDARILADAYGYTINLPSTRRAFPSYLNTASRLLTVNGDQKAVNNTITLDVVGSQVVVNVDGVVTRYDIGSVSTIKVTSGEGIDTINVLRTAPTVPVQINSRGTASVNVGTNRSVQEIRGILEISNDRGGTTITVDDSADQSQRTVNWDSMPEAGVLGYGYSALVGLAPAPIRYDNYGTRSVSIRTSGGGGQVNVPFVKVYTALETFGYTVVGVKATSKPLNVIGNSATTVNVGDNGSVQRIRGRLVISSAAALVVDNSADLTAHTVVLDTIVDDYFGIDSGYIRGLAPELIIYPNAGIRSVTVKLGRGSNAVKVGRISTPTGLENHGPTTVNLGVGDSVGGSVQGIRRDMSLINSGGTLDLTVDNSADPAARTFSLNTLADRVYGFDFGEILGLAPGKITFDNPGTNGVTIRTGGGNNVVNVGGTSVPTTLESNGVNTVNLGSNGMLDEIRGAVMIRNGRGTTTLNINDSASGTDKTVNFAMLWDSLGIVDPLEYGTVGYFYGLAPAMIWYEARGTSRVTIRTSPNSRYRGPSSPVPTTFNGRTVP